MKYLKHYVTVFNLLFFTISLSGQTFKEIGEFHDNGKKKTETIKNDELEIIRINAYDINEELIEYTNFDPKSGIKEGEFMYGSNKGFFKNGELNCDYCVVMIPKSRNNVIYKGGFRNGKPVGLIDVYKVYENRNLDRYDPYINFLQDQKIDKRIFYSSFKGIPMFEEEKLFTLNFDDNGNLNGEQKIMDEITFYYKNGLLNKILTINSKKNPIYKDSISRENKIWKINNKYIKNNGWIYFYFNEFKLDRRFILNSVEKVESDESTRMQSDLMFFGDENTQYSSGLPLVGIEFYGYGDLMENGLYEKITSKRDLKDEFLLNLFIPLPVEFYEFDIRIKDIPILEWLNIKDIESRETKDEFGRKIEVVKTQDIFEKINGFIGNNLYPIKQVYISDDIDPSSSEKINYKTYENYHKEIIKISQNSLENQKNRLFNSSKVPTSESNNSKIINEIDRNKLELWLTSDKKENKKKYNIALKWTLKSVSGLLKIHQLSYEGNLNPSQAYFRYFFENTESLDSFSDYLIEAGTHWIVEKDYNGLILTIGPKN